MLSHVTTEADVALTGMRTDETRFIPGSGADLFAGPFTWCSRLLCIDRICKMPTTDYVSALDRFDRSLLHSANGLVTGGCAVFQMATSTISEVADLEIVESD